MMWKSALERSGCGVRVAIREVEENWLLASEAMREHGWVDVEREELWMDLREAAKLIGTEGINVAGRIKWVGERKSGEGEYGEWSSQMLVLSDGSGELMVQLKNVEQVLAKSAVGMWFSADSVMQERLGKKTGVKIAAWKDEDTGKGGVKAIVTASAILRVANDKGRALETPEGGEATREPVGVPLDAAKALMRELLEWASLEAAREETRSLSFTSEDWQKIVTTMFIRMSGGR